MMNKEEINKLKDKINQLEKKNIDLIITDFDDTIFSTKKLIEKDYRKWKRWQEWNQYIIENNLIKKIIDEVYKNAIYPKNISSKLRKNHDLILTAWIDLFQIEKIKATNLEHINLKIVNEPKEKIIKTIEYITDTLWFLPNKVTVYEDRPKYFIEYKKLLENILNIPFDIMYVEMTDNYSEPKISKIN